MARGHGPSAGDRPDSGHEHCLPGVGICPGAGRQLDREIVASWYDDDAARAQALAAWETAGVAMEEAAGRIYANLMNMLREQ